MSISRLALGLLALLCIGSVHAQIFKWVDEDGNVTFSDRPPPSERQLVKPVDNEKSAPRPIAHDGKHSDRVTEAEYGRPHVLSEPISLTLEVRSLLRRHAHSELNTLLENYQVRTEEDIVNEDALFAAYAAFDVKETSYESLLNTWIEATPDAYQPYLARAQFYYRMAWKARGGKWASETSKEQISAMNAYLAKSLKDLEVAMESARKSMVAYSLLIGIMSTKGESEKMFQAFQGAIEINPATYRVRVRFLQALTPRWGGSYELMHQFAEKSQEYAALNPKMKLLYGYILRDAGQMSASSRAYTKADALFTDALAYGENHAVLYDRGKNSYRREKYTDALEDMNRAIEQNRENGEYFYWRSKIYGKMERYERALEDVIHARLFEPGDDYIERHHDWLVSRLERKGYEEYKERNPSAAISSFNMALVANPAEASLYYRRARALVDLNDFESAVSDVKQAIVLDPGDYDYYLLLDWLLAKKQDWDQIIEYWDQYIALHPDNSRAYVERGGAYFRKGNLRAAVNNAKIASEMGNVEGREAYEKYKDRVR